MLKFNYFLVICLFFISNDLYSKIDAKDNWEPLGKEYNPSEKMTERDIQIMDKLCENPNYVEPDTKENKAEYLNAKIGLLGKLKFWKNKETQVRYKFNKISMIIPEELYFIIDGFKNESLLLKRLILYGPPGNGKSMLANEIAKELNAGFIEVHAPSLISLYQGSGATAIENCFQEAIKFKDNEQKKVVIFIDEIDAIAPKFTGDDRFHDHKAALQNLWLWLDKVKNIPEVYVVFATNRFEKLDKAFITRFDSNVIELKNPDETARKEIIEFYIEEFNKQISKPVEINQSLINNLVKKTNNFNVRSIEGVVRLLIQKMSRNKGDIKSTFISDIIYKQKNLILANNKDKKKTDIYQKINFGVNTISASLGIINLSMIFYDKYISHKKDKEFWGLILKITKNLSGGEKIHDMIKDHQDSILKFGAFLNLQSLAILGTLLATKNMEKIKEVATQQIASLPKNLWNGFRS